MRMKPVKCLLIGNSGAGKTSALASLVKAGYELAIIDTDNGTDILYSLLSEEDQKRVFCEVVTNQVKATVYGPQASGGLQINKILGLFSNWKTESCNLGAVLKWNTERVLVIDSLTSLGDICLQQVSAMQGKKLQDFYLKEWGAAISIQQGVVQFLAQESVKCNVVVTAHIRHLYGKGKEEAVVIGGLPSALGKLFPANIGRFFNNIFLVETAGFGKGIRRVIRTVPTQFIDAKNASPTLIKDSLLIETGLAEIFKILLKKS